MKRTNNQFSVQLSVAVFVVLIMFSCDKNDDLPPVGAIDYSEGVFIINEGAFTDGSGTVTFINRSGTEIRQNIFQNANATLPLGSIAQSMNVVDNKAFIVVNNANKIEIANTTTFKTMGSVLNITMPRYIVSAGGTKTYISCWDNTVAIYDYKTFQISGHIPVGTGPEKMLKVDNEVWVLNQGGYSIDSSVSVINTVSNMVVKTIQVFPTPSGIQEDKNGKVWILCSGRGNNYQINEETDSRGHLVCIDPVTYAIEKDIVFPLTSKHPEKLVINSTGDVLFYNYPSGIYRFNISSSEPEDMPFVSRDGFCYGLGLDKTDNVIYSSDPVDFVQNGRVFRYDASNGNEIDSFEAGITPGEFCFSE